MKNLLLIILLVLNLAAFSQGGLFQHKSKNINYSEEKINETEYPRKAYKIIVKNNLSADENYVLVGKTLLDNDWVIESKDKDFHTIKTAIREMYKSRTGSYFLNFTIKDKAIAIMGQCYVDLTMRIGFVESTNASYKISYKGMDGNLNKNAFLKMADFAKKLGTEFEFVTEN